MASALRCSVVVPTYNRAELLGYTLESLARQKLPSACFEVLVCDDGSSDHTAAVVDGYRDRLNLRYFFHERDGYGAARTRNVGIRNATADICVLMDSGVMMHSGCLAAHLASHEAVDEAAGGLAVIGYVHGFDLDNANAAEIEQSIDRWDADATIERMARARSHDDVREEFYAQHGDDFAHLPAPWVMFWTCNVSVRTDQLRAVGMFDENFRGWGGEDLDLGYRLHCHDARFVLNRAASAVHYPHEKDSDAGFTSALVNYRQMIMKYRSPIIPLLLAVPTINPFNINDVIPVLDLPPGAEKLDAKRQSV